MNHSLWHQPLQTRISLFLLLGLVTLLNFRVLIQAPYQAGGDIFFHTWFTQELLDNGEVPRSSPTYDATTHYTLAPFFHLFAGALAQVTQLPLITIFSLLNVLFALVWTGMLFLLLYRLSGNAIAALFGVVLSFFFTDETGFIYFLPRTLTMLFVMMAILVIVTSWSLRIRRLLLAVLTLALFGTHLPSAPFWFAILCTVILARKETSWKNRWGDIGACVAGVLLFTAGLLPEILKNGLPVNPSDPSFQTQGEGNTALQQIMQVLRQPLLLFFVALGLLELFRQLWKEANEKTWTVVAIVLSSMVVAFQEFGNYAFLPERALAYLLIPFTLVSTYAVHFLFRVITPPIWRRAVFAVVLLVMLPLGARQMLSHELPPIRDSVGWDELHSLRALGNALPEARFVSDPLTMVKVATIAGLTPAIEFEATHLRAADTRNWPVVQGLFSTQEKLLPYLSEVNTEIVVISADTYRWYLRSDERFTKSNNFTLLFQSEAVTRVEGFAEPIPYYSAYRLESTGEAGQ